jgi:hypothetical protein
MIPKNIMASNFSGRAKRDESRIASFSKNEAGKAAERIVQCDIRLV